MSDLVKFETGELSMDLGVNDDVPVGKINT